MPITKQAIKKLHHDRARTKQNTKQRLLITKLTKKARKSPSAKTITLVFAALDKAVKRNIIHKNTAARTKSRLSKLLAKK